jgi:hypothetical protein
MGKSLILDKLEIVKDRYEEVGRMLTAHDAMDDMKSYQ